MCGEHWSNWDELDYTQGSSPRVRGTPPSAKSPDGKHGIIPACAGNTGFEQKRRTLVVDHPRVCGEHCAAPPPWPISLGSSPRVRGTPHICNSGVIWRGIIPACAGNTLPSPAWRASARDHPRVCGEHVIRSAMNIMSMGSSPRVRGTLDKANHIAAALGIIPACAGNTKIFCASFPYRPGSSPRVRGTPISPLDIAKPYGIIPACAGNTTSSPSTRLCGRDHPRVCGEHVTMK